MMLFILPLVTSQSVAAGVPNALIRRYDTAENHIGLSAVTPIPLMIPDARPA